MLEFLVSRLWSCNKMGKKLILLQLLFLFDV
jgi:hypothetical protein